MRESGVTEDAICAFMADLWLVADSRRNDSDHILMFQGFPQHTEDGTMTY